MDMKVDSHSQINVEEPTSDGTDRASGTSNSRGFAASPSAVPVIDIHAAGTPAAASELATPRSAGGFFDDEDAATEFTVETVNRQWSTGTNCDERRQQRKWLLHFINRYVPPEVDEGDAFVVVKLLVEAEIITAELVEEHQIFAKGTQRFMSYFEELTDADWDATGRITTLYLGYKDSRDCPWELHPDIGRLNKLKHLTVGFCVGLPAELSKLEELETLKLTMNVDEKRYDMPASEPPAVELSSLKELDAKAAPGVVGFNLPSWIGNSSFPNLEVLTLEDEPGSTYSDIVAVLESLKKNYAKDHSGLRQLAVRSFEIAQNFDTFLLDTIPDFVPHLESLKFQDGKPYLTSVTNVHKRLKSGDFSDALRTSVKNLTTLDLQETQLFGHRDGRCLIEQSAESTALSDIVMSYDKLTVVGFTPRASSKKVLLKFKKNGVKGTKASDENKVTQAIKNENINNKDFSASRSASSSGSSKTSQQDSSAASKKNPRRNSASSLASNDTGKASKGSTKPDPVKSEYHTPLNGSSRRGDSYIGRRFAKYFNMACDEDEDFEKLFFGSITKKITSEIKPLQYRVDFDDGDTLDMEMEEIHEGLDLYDEKKGRDRKKGTSKRKR